MGHFPPFALPTNAPADPLPRPVSGTRPWLPPRVLHVAAGAMLGGVEQMLLEIARSHGAVEVAFALCHDAAPAQALRALGVAPHVLPAPRLSRPLAVLRARRALAALLARERFDGVVMHAPWVQALLGGVVRRAGLEPVLYLHDAPDAPGTIDHLARLSRPSVVVANSRYTAARGERLYALGRRPRWVAPPVAPPSLADGARRGQVRAELGAGPDDVVLLQVGRLAPYKGQDVLVEAAARLAPSARAVVCIAGGAQRPEEREFERRLHALATARGVGGRVRFLGRREDVRALLAAADVFVHANRGGEPFGMAFVEAMYAGLPVVGATGGATPDVVTPECGLLVAPGDAAALATALERLLGDAPLRARLGAAGPARARELCDPVARVAELHAIARGAAREAA